MAPDSSSPSAAVRSVRSLAHRTDLALLERAGSRVEDRGTHLVVRTPDNPGFYWGNFLLLRELPLPGGAREAMAACWTEFPTCDHRAVAFDVTEPLDDHPVLAEFLDAGMVATTAVALTATSITAAPHPHPEADVRPLATDEDWDQRVALMLALDDDGSGSDSTREYARQRAAAERRLGEQGLGHRWGAFVEGRLLSTAGLYRVADDVARYQSVETHPDARRQGLAGTVVHRAAEHALAELGARTLVIVAEEEAPAARLYRSLGFEGSERVVELLARP